MKIGKGSETRELEWKKIRTRFMVEVKKVVTIAAPMVASSMLQNLLQLVSVIMVAHLNQLSLSSVSIATSITNISGFSILSGMAGGIETLCGQAFGAGQFEKLGIYTYTAVISLAMVCAPISVLWIFLDKILVFIGQDPEISIKAHIYALWLIPGLFGSAILKPLTRFFQTQRILSPMIISSLIGLCFHGVACWVLVFKLALGSVGTAIAFSLGIWLNVVILLYFVKYSSACERTRVPFSKKAFLGFREFFDLAVPSAAMVCLKWWACEVIFLLAGLLSNPKLETSVLSICMSISTLHFTISFGLGAATSTRVSNELGAGNPKAGRFSVCTAMILAVIEALIVVILLFGCRNVLGYAYTHDNGLVHYVAAMIPFLCASIFTDSLQAVLSGAAKGSGWQRVGAYVNLGAFYLVGIPVGVVLGFVVHFKARGLWIGIVCGSIVQTFFLSIITARIDWKKQALMARERVFHDATKDGCVSDLMTDETVLQRRLQCAPTLINEEGDALRPAQL